MQRRDLLVTLAGVAPFVAVWIAKVVVRPRPFWAAYADPEMFFFYDGLRLLHGDPPVNIDHPGTPIQLLAAAMARLMDPTPLAVDRYRVAMYIATALLTLAGTLFLVRGRLLRPLPAPLQIAVLWTFWLAPAALRQAAIASPEVIELPFAALAMTALAAYAEERSRRAAMWLGAAIGALIGVKFVFGTWLLAAGLAALLAGGRTLRERALDAVTIGLSAIAGFALATAAAAARWPDMVAWVVALLTHSRWYGEGTVAPPSAGDLLRSLMTAAMAAKVWHLWLLLALAMLVAAWWRRRELALIAIFCLTATILNFAAAAKGLVPTAAQGFGDIRYRYLLPAALAAVIALAFACRVATSRAAQAVLLVVAGLLAIKATVAEVRTHAGIVALAEEQRAALDRVLAPLRRPGLTVVYAYAPAPSFALRFPTYDRRFMMTAVLETRAAGSGGPAFNAGFLRAIERRYPDEGHFFAHLISLPAGRTQWDLFVRRENDAEAAAAAPGMIVGRAAGYVVVRR